MIISCDWHKPKLMAMHDSNIDNLPGIPMTHPCGDHTSPLTPTATAAGIGVAIGWSKLALVVGAAVDPSGFTADWAAGSGSCSNPQPGAAAAGRWTTSFAEMASPATVPRAATPKPSPCSPSNVEGDGRGSSAAWEHEDELLACYPNSEVELW
jgi:hypothetical protein